MDIFLTILFTLPLGIPYTSFAEYWLHRFVMHQPLRIFGWVFDYPYKAHAETHHGIFGSDASYHLHNPADEETIPMAWWNGPLLVVLGTIPFALISFPLALMDWVPWRIVLTCCGTEAIIILLYYGAYESTHWVMHKPVVLWIEGTPWYQMMFKPLASRIEKTDWFKRINARHLLHHYDMRGRNFNVVLPIADWICRTRITRAETPFDQPQGSMIPDVQPLSR